MRYLWTRPTPALIGPRLLPGVLDEVLLQC
jgi:hypothetical protein